MVCFAAGTLIDTELGPVAVEHLQPGVAVTSPDGSSPRLRLSLHRRVGAGELSAHPKLRPVRIAAGALGAELPRRDLLVSRQHRMLLHSAIAERMFGQPEVLIPAIRLTGLPGITIDETVTTVTYYHLLFDRHELVFAEGAPSESLYATGRALDTLDAATLEEVATLFPELPGMARAPIPVRPIPSTPRQTRLIARHRKNTRALVAR